MAGYVVGMSDVTRILSQIEQGDPKAAEKLLPLVYDELRRLAGRCLTREKPGQTLQATALVHEAYLRLAGPDEGQIWNSRGHFFAAAAEAMRRILVEQARRKHSIKAGGEYERQELPDIEAPSGAPKIDLLALDETFLRFRSPGRVALTTMRAGPGWSSGTACLPNGRVIRR